MLKMVLPGSILMVLEGRLNRSPPSRQTRQNKGKCGALAGEFAPLARYDGIAPDRLYCAAAIRRTILHCI